jgi:amino acid transporter
MISFSLHDVQLTMAIFAFTIGFITFAIGLFILISTIRNKEIKTLADQTTKLAQKGLAEEVAGLVGNASALITALNSMVATTAGVGLFLTILAVLIMIGAFWLIFGIH